MIEQTVEELTPVICTRPACRALSAAPATIYRRRRPHVAGANGHVRERRDQLAHPPYRRPELLAERPNAVWSWDISKLKGPARWTCFYLYAILDVFSRYCLGWTVQHRESAGVAEQLIGQAVEQQQVGRHRLTVHADRGPSMTSKPVAFLLADLGVTKTHSRPYTSTDNPYSEGAVQGAQVPARVPAAVRLDRARRRVLPRVLRLVQPPAPPLGHRSDDARDRPPRPRRRRPRRTRPCARCRLRRDARAVRPPRADAAAGTGGGLDQQAQHRGGRSLNSNADRLIRLDRLRPMNCATARTLADKSADPSRSAS
jgi:integrase-like protein